MVNIDSSKRKKVGSRFQPFDPWKASSRETALYAVFFASGASGLLKNTLTLELTKENRALVRSVYLYTLCLADRVKEA